MLLPKEEQTVHRGRGQEQQVEVDETKPVTQCKVAAVMLAYFFGTLNLFLTDQLCFRCKRKPGAQCSPSEGPCCNKQCRFVQKFDHVQCKHEQDCTEAASCDGAQAKCPDPEAKPDNITECNEGTQVCQGGECKSSICLKFGRESCFLTSDLVQDKRELCELACLHPGSGPNATCTSTRELVAKGIITDLSEGLNLRPGSPCDNFQASVIKLTDIKAVIKLRIFHFAGLL